MSVTQLYKNSQSEILSYQAEVDELRDGLAIAAALCMAAIPCMLLLLMARPA